MSSELEVLRLLAEGDIDSANHLVSRQGGSVWARGCVKAAQGKFFEAANIFFTDAQYNSAAVASALLEPWQLFPRLTAVQKSVPAELGAAIEVVVNEQPFEKTHVEAIAAHMPRDVRADVSRKAAEYNIFCVARVAEVAQISTIQQFVDKAAQGVDATDAVCVLIEREAIDCAVNQVSGTVEFSRSDASTRQSTHLRDLFEKVEQQTAPV